MEWPQLNVRHRSRDSRLPMAAWKQFPTYESKGHSGIVGAERIQNPVHGIRTIFLKMRPDKDVAVGSTFAGVLFKNLSSLSVRCPTQMLWMFTDLWRSDKDVKIPIHKERPHLYLTPIAFIQDMGDCHSSSVLTYQDSQFKMIAPSYTSATMKRTFQWQHILLGVLQRSWHSSTSSEMSTSSSTWSRTVQVSQKDSRDSDSATEWWSTRTSRRIGHNADNCARTQWRAMARLYGALPSEQAKKASDHVARLTSKESEAEVKGEDLQRKGQRGHATRTGRQAHGLHTSGRWFMDVHKTSLDQPSVFNLEDSCS